ncbi:MAG: hypothetical protein IJ863_07295 [Spirochaetales bacterium]|nr:hypothetical protein [Spirochaetales bacterium]
MELIAPAKVNWHLAVGRRRPDGYHPIASIFQTCSLSDRLHVEIGEGPFSVDVRGLEGLCPKGKSTLEKAANLWHERMGFDRSISILVEKRIPSQAGLGGGSSDAATLLRYLNSQEADPLDVEDLMRIGLDVGCDVPFFIRGCRTALVSGLGEIVRPIEPRTDLKGFILIPEGGKTSTREAYGALDGRAVIPDHDDLDDLEMIYRLPVREWSFRNDFGIVNTRPDIGLLDGERLILTGSGSCHVLLSDREDLELNGGLKAERVTF